MKTTHTPGPWTFRDGNLLTWAIVPATGPVVAYIAEIARPDNDGEGFVEADANAALIASAPELLAALEGLLKLGDPDHHYGCSCWECAAHAQARAAIAKAKGPAS